MIFHAYLDDCTPDLIVLQNLTFANAAYASEVLHRFHAQLSYGHCVNQ
jgi:hypothetical protein